MAVADPWPEEVDGAALADELVTIIKRHVIVFDRQVHAAALWIILTYLEDVLDCLTLLAIQSPVKRCGKTIFLSLLSRLVCKPLQTSNTSTAALYRVIERFRPTLLIDEVDAWLKDNEEARGILNSGHTRDLAFVLRCNAESNEPERFSTWARKVLAGIDRKSTRLNSSHTVISYAVFCLKKKNKKHKQYYNKNLEALRDCHASSPRVIWQIYHCACV